MNDPADLAPRPPVEPLRRVDWLTLAPWLIVLRAPKVAWGWPLVIGAAGSLLLRRWTTVDPLGGPISTAYSQLARFVADRVHWHYALGIRPDGTPHLALDWWAWAARLAGWIAMGLLVVHCIDRRAERDVQRRWDIGRLGRRLKNVLGCFALLGAAAAIPVGLLLGYSAALASEAWCGYAAPLWGLVAVAAGLPIAIAWLLGIVACPLLLAAVVFDESDPFDALSRTAAYTLQKPMTLAGVVLVAWLGGVAGGAIVEWALRNLIVVMEAFGSRYSTIGESAAADASWRLVVTAARGFYPAYIFTAGVSVYLVMRQAVDGLPLGQTASANGRQPSPPA